MKTYTKTTVEEVPRLVIKYDDDAQSPRDWDNLGYFITSESRYNSPDDKPEYRAIVREEGETAGNVTEHMQQITERIRDEHGEKVIAIYPVVRYEHSGVSYSLGVKHGFDYSNCGFYIVTEDSAKNIGAKKEHFEQLIKDEISIYTQYVNGEVYMYESFDKDGNSSGWCGGYYSLDEIKSELIDNYGKKEWSKEKLSDYMKY